MDSPDYLSSKFHSQILVNKIRAYYLKKGRDTHVWIEKEGPSYVVRSSIRFALPSPQ